MTKLSMTIAAAIVLACAGGAWAGPFSPGMGGPEEESFPDAGVAGFVGPAGEGVTGTGANGNFLNPVFVGWATGVALYDPSDTLGPYEPGGIGRPPEYALDFGDGAKATGPATGDDKDVVCLGDMNASEIAAHLADPAGAPTGTLVLTFARPIADGAGADFAVFENGMVSAYSTSLGSASGTMFAELAYVEVSTDGTTFARFPCEYLNSEPAGSLTYLTQDVSNIRNLVGKHANDRGVCWGTPFDLAELADHPRVLDGTVALDEINYVRIVDIPGDGSFTDSLGRPIYDAWVTWGSGGVDIEAVGVIHVASDRRVGDANGDGAVDLADFVIVKSNFGAANVGWSEGDFDGDGTVTLADFVILKNHFGS